MKKLFLILIIIGIAAALTVQAQKNDEFLHELYDKLHDSPMQQKFKKIAPVPAGVVYIQQPTDGEKEIRAHFKTMKQLGFNALKQIMVNPGWTEEQIALIALEEGIIPYWYGEGGWEDITDELLKKLGIPKTMSIPEIRKHPKMVEYQKNVLIKRIKDMEKYTQANGGKPIRSTSVAYDPEVGNRGQELTPHGEELYIEWCKKTYTTIENLNKAYNQDVANLSITPYGGFKDWEDFKKNWRNISGREFRHFRDILRFKVEYNLNRIDELAQKFQEVAGKDAPYRGGGEMSLYLPAAFMSVDMEGIADVIRKYGSFYPSQHFTWHYEQTDHEIVRPFYQQASLMNDFFKGGWTGGWESSGGPQQISGEKQAIGNSYYVDGGTLLQFYLSQLAAGFKGFGIWCWNSRPSGGEGGEYALLDRNNNVTDRAVKIGELAKALDKYRDEIWKAKKEPTVGILNNWENDAMWGVVSLAGPEEFKMKPIFARIGVSRALQNQNIPFEYVTVDDIKNGLAARYKVIYLPAMLTLNTGLIELLTKYVEGGGRLIMDAPGAWYDEYGDVVNTSKGSAFEKLFGVLLTDVQYSGVNRTFQLDGKDLKGFTFDLTPTTAKIIATYSHGKAGITENNLGKGKAIILGYEASLNCFKQGNTDEEKKLVRYALGEYTPTFTCEGSLVYRLSAPTADYYIFINDGEATTVNLDTKNYKYKAVTDAISGEKLNLGAAIKLEAHSGRWLRFEK
jgi:beta-galactosidase